MSIIQRNDKGQGDATGYDYFGGFFSDGVSPFWVSKERALDVPNAGEVAEQITVRYKYALLIGSQNDQRNAILAMMRSGELPKEKVIAMLRNQRSEHYLPEDNRSHPVVMTWRKNSQIFRLVQKYGLRCHWCHRFCNPGIPVNADAYPTREHLIRRADGGSSRMTNLVVACRKCNNTRHGQ